MTDDRWLEDYWRVCVAFPGVNKSVSQLLTDLTYMKRKEESNNQTILYKPSVNASLICPMNKDVKESIIKPGG
jgi:hypothetical protein